MASADAQVRVHDFLDDRLQARADLETVETLLAGVRNQHGLLQSQLRDARANLQSARQSSQEHATAVRARASRFERDQRDIDRRLSALTRSEVSDDAVARFESSMNKLEQLQVVTGYAELLKTTDRLNTECRVKLERSADEGLKPYIQLQELASTLGPLQEAAEGAAPHLVDHITNTARDAHSRIKEKLSGDFQTVLKKMFWPKSGASLPVSLQEDWTNSVQRLLDLQKPELEAQEHAVQAGRSDRAPTLLLPLDVMVKPLEMGFRYHFQGDRPTNRPDKPERFLSYALNLLDTHNSFMVDHLQPILLQQFRGTVLATNATYMDATSTLITAILPMVRAKVFALVSDVAGQPQLLSHLIHELMSFDTTIREDWGYDGGYGVEGWKGVAWEVLVQKNWFERWMQVEKDFALARYQAIIDTSDSGELDFDSVEPNVTKPTKAAIRVHDLLDTVTDLYRPLSSFTQKLRFLIDIQISIFDRFHEWLHSSLEAYLTMTSSLGRTVQGISKEEQSKLHGVTGLERLCRVYGSADYLERAMREWGDDVFFLELYTELQERASNHPPSSAQPLAGPLTVAQIASRTSQTIDPAAETAPMADGPAVPDSGALFDETAAAFARLRIRCESIIIEQLVYGAREALRPYRASNPWASLTLPGSSSSTAASASSPSPGAGLSASPDLAPLLRTHLPAHLTFLTRALAPAPRRRVARALAQAIDGAVFDGVLLRHAFSAAGAAQFAADVTSIEAAFVKTVGGGDLVTSGGGTWLKKCWEGARIVGVRAGDGDGAEGGPAGGDDEEEHAWGEIGEDAEGESAEGARGEDGGLDLWGVERRLFANNESARSLLAEMGLESLTETEARAVLGKRVELGR